jgi:hypothetical protein
VRRKQTIATVQLQSAIGSSGSADPIPGESTNPDLPQKT